MSDSALSQHQPAIKVGGRRLSVNSRPKPHVSPELPPTDSPAEPADYPRPAPPGDDQAVHPPPHHEEEAPKKEKKHNQGNHESAYKRKFDHTKPAKEMSGSKTDFGAAGRIAQPAARGLA